MTDRGAGPQIHSIAAHRGFADALVAGLGPRYGEAELGLARLTLLLPSQRAVRTVTEAFVRLLGADDAGKAGLLLPRMVAVGDLDLDETLGPLFDRLDFGADIPPAADKVRRWLRLAELLRDQAGSKLPAPARLRQAMDIARGMDRLLVEGIAPEALFSERVVGVVGEQARHWIEATRTFAVVQAHWLAELAARGEVDAPARRNMLFDAAARDWRENPPPHPVVAAGITSASPALARLLRVVSELPRGAVILPDLDLELEGKVWDALGTAGAQEHPDDPPFGLEDAVTHPQYHLKLLLNRMGIARDEVQPWHRSGLTAAPPARSKAISSLFLPPAASSQWMRLSKAQRSLADVRLMTTAHPGEEAQAIAILIREALDVPERRVALVTPDRALASRVISHLERWGVRADDSAGTPLGQTPAGRLFLKLAEVLAAEAAPVPLVALLGHPLAGLGHGRAEWLDGVRALELRLRGPRPGPGLAPLAALAERARAGAWWQAVDAILAPLFALPKELPLADALDGLAAAAEALSGGTVWSDAAGRALSAFVEALREAAREAQIVLSRADLAQVLRDAMEQEAVRTPWGGHPRVAIYGLIEARMSRADLVICGGMTEGNWPGRPRPDALLAPAVLRALGVPGGDFRIGLAAHDLASALGAPEVVLSHATRDAAGPAIPSRFLLRLQAMLGAELVEKHREVRAVELARAIDRAPAEPRHPRPAPDPLPEQREVVLNVTALDRLRGDPYQFYAGEILRLKVLDRLDAEPSAAWRGTAVHAIFEAWHKGGHEHGGHLHEIAEAELAKMSAHPLARGLWWPRLIAGLDWVEGQIAELASQGRVVIASEAKGEMAFDGVILRGRADRIDRLAHGTLAIVDYKTGSPPSAKQVEKGYALQLGAIGLLARAGAFENVAGKPENFEYWTLRKSAKNKATGFGEVISPFRKNGIQQEDFLSVTEEFLGEAIANWIMGREPFTARLNLDYQGYNDYDQLMRLDEWLGQD